MKQRVIGSMAEGVPGQLDRHSAHWLASFQVHLPSQLLTPSSVLVGNDLSFGIWVLWLAANMVVLKPAGPSVP